MLLRSCIPSWLVPDRHRYGSRKNHGYRGSCIPDEFKKVYTVGVAKPFESGVPDPMSLGEDGRLLQWASSSRDDVHCITPYRLREPLAPAFAARREGVDIDWPHVID